MGGRGGGGGGGGGVIQATLQDISGVLHLVGMEDVLQCLLISCGQFDVCGCHILLQVLDAPGAGDWKHIVSLGMDPGKGQLAGRAVLCGCQRSHLVYKCKVLQTQQSVMCMLKATTACEPW